MTPYLKVYRAACAKIKEIESLACKRCFGHGYVNPAHHHTTTKDHPESETCPECEGSGFRVQ